MSVKLRLTRRGAKKRPFYWVVAAHSRSPRDGRFLEKLGTYNPMLAKDAEKRIVLVEERIRHWLAVGAEPSDRVARMLYEKGILAAPPARREQTKKPLPKAKAQERLQAAEAAATAAAEEAAKPEADSAPEATEAPEAPETTEATEATEAKEAESNDSAPEAEAEKATPEATPEKDSPEKDTGEAETPEAEKS